MLSMKTLKVAIVTMGSALLLGPGLATAVDYDIDSTARTGDGRSAHSLRGETVTGTVVDGDTT